MPTSPKPARTLLTCPQCPKQFGKQTKLDRHLLEDHAATLRISPGALTPPRSPTPSEQLVASALTAALDEAHRVFENTPRPPVCPLCNDPARRSFKNQRDLAQHFVSKHSDWLGMGDGEVAVPLRVQAPTQSEMSVNPGKRPDATAKPDRRGRADADASAVAPAIGLVLGEPNKPASASPPAPKRNAPAKTIAKKTSSGSRPPVTPKRSQKARVAVAPKESAMRAAAAAKTGDTAALKTAESAAPFAGHPMSVLRAARAVSTAPMDFSGMAGFATNARKSYYRLSNR